MTQRVMDTLESALSLLMPLTSRRRGAAVLDPPAPPDIPDRPDTLTQEITVTSYNVLCNTVGKFSLRYRYNGVLQTIMHEKPDSVGLQEAHDIWRGRLRRGLEEAYGVACDTGRVFGVGEGMPIYYRRDKFDLVKQGVFWLSEHPGISSVGWDASCPRVAGWAVLRDKRTGFTYAHFNTHLDHKGPAAMANGARLMADRVNALGLPAVLTGDMNGEPGSAQAGYFAAAGLADLRFAAQTSDTGPTYHGYSGYTTVIDYVFANHYLRGAKEFKVIRDEYDGMYPSDHFAVSATLTLAN
ncbi:MAG: endonuclease/exonuclease/phosphatase family protein [Oscillospiraceae bacterium]|nr:endonuclease/exonuclease/phosphatase family protein [Oscillospiraceae bacterium]